MTDKHPRSQVARHSKELLLLLSVPLGIIFIIVALLYIPRLFANPTYDFIYCEGYSCNQRFTINSSNKITSRPDASYRTYDEATLRYYDVSRDATRPLSLGEAASYQLDPMSKSPEGYSLENVRSSSGFLLWSDYSSDWSLKKGMVSKPVSLGSGGSDKKFIGWVLNDGQ